MSAYELHRLGTVIKTAQNLLQTGQRILLTDFFLSRDLTNRIIGRGGEEAWVLAEHGIE